jgi:hypothetical protein
MILFKRCPRCRGDLFLVRGNTRVNQFVCLQCGRGWRAAGDSLTGAAKDSR